MLKQFKTVLLFPVVSAVPVTAAPVSVFVDRHVAQAEFAAHEIMLAFKAKDQSINLQDIGKLKSIKGTQIILMDLSRRPTLDMFEKSKDGLPGKLFYEFLEGVGGQFDENDDEADLVLNRTIAALSFLVLSATKTSQGTIGVLSRLLPDRRTAVFVFPVRMGLDIIIRIPEELP